MKYVLVLLAFAGIVLSSLALREHFNDGPAPCYINDRWDCGVVNHSPYAVILNIPVAAIGIAGYLLLGALAFRRSYRMMMLAVLPALLFSFYLAHVEKDVLRVWCIYCVGSLGVIVSMSLLLVVANIRGAFQRNDNSASDMRYLKAEAMRNDPS